MDSGYDGQDDRDGFGSEEERQKAGEVQCALMGTHEVRDGYSYPLMCSRCRKVIAQSIFTGYYGKMGSVSTASTACVVYPTPNLIYSGTQTVAGGPYSTTSALGMKL